MIDFNEKSPVRLYTAVQYVMFMTSTVRSNFDFLFFLFFSFFSFFKWSML